jgi:high-affinity nickel-transport protein
MFRVPELRSRLAGIYGFLALLNVGVWVAALSALPAAPVSLGLMLTVYGLGLRHAVDADHIAAIDNVTRKLLADGQRPLTVGLFFALGHSAVVLIVTILVTQAARLLVHLDRLRELGETVGTAISALFLFVIALMNLAVFASVLRSSRRLQLGDDRGSDPTNHVQRAGGLLSRLLLPLSALVSRSWHMLFVGFLFGLGFDTATEVAMFSLSIVQAAHGASWWAVLLFPMLFAAAMVLADTTDGVVMLGAYAWALVEPRRRVSYNLIITLLSAVIALVVGSIEALGLIGERFGMSGASWDAVAALGGHLTGLGLLIILLIAVVWGSSYLFIGPRNPLTTARLSGT